ncbi:MAG: DnaA regulatory inactivator Hda [Pseudomonadales bacterium]
MNDGATQIPLNIVLPPENDFANFYVTERNRESVNAIALLAQCETPAVAWLYGESGSGRTHLLEAACLEAQHLQHSVVYLPLKDLCASEPDGVLEGLDQMDLLCLDDVHCLQDSAAWQEALFHLYNRVQQGQTNLLLSADRAPRLCDFDLRDLASRLNSALVYRLFALDDTAKAACLTLRANNAGLQLSAEVCDFILRRGERSMGALCQTIKQLDHASLAEQRRLTVPFVKQVLGW